MDRRKRRKGEDGIEDGYGEGSILPGKEDVMLVGMG